MVARCMDAGKGANHANRRKARQSVTAWLVAQEAAPWRAMGPILLLTAEGSDPQPFPPLPDHVLSQNFRRLSPASAGAVCRFSGL